MSLKSFLPLIFAASLLLSCATTPAETEKDRSNVASGQEKAPVDDPTAEIRRKLVASAYSLVGKDSLVINGKEFTLDCSGTIAAIYWAANIDLTKEFAKYTGNGVTRIYKTLENHGLIYLTKLPKPGDLIFWDNTWDRNGDGQWNDPLTHAGMVIEVFSNGDITYVHENYRKGIIMEKMNLYEPATRTRIENGETIIVNSPMRMRSQIWENGIWSAGQLVRDFGKGYLLP